MVSSLVEPLRKILARSRSHLLNAKVSADAFALPKTWILSMLAYQALDLVMSDRLLEVEVVSPAGPGTYIYAP